MARRRRQFEPEQVQVVDIDHQGRGVATASDGKTVFVHGVLPGETATIQRMRRHRRFDEAKLLSLEEASPHRVTPKCQAFDVCGGCALQHLSADIQIQ
ncbi:MAG: TRAM domain-containing protein, partial [Pseudomonadota bacterium]